MVNEENASALSLCNFATLPLFLIEEIENVY